MSYYDGPERRDHPCVIGEAEFAVVKTKVSIMEPQVAEMHPIVTNGLSDLPVRMKWLIGLMVTLVLGMTGIGFGLATNLIEAAERQGRIEQMVHDHIEWGAGQNARTLDMIKELEDRINDTTEGR